MGEGVALAEDGVAILAELPGGLRVMQVGLRLPPVIAPALHAVDPLQDGFFNVIFALVIDDDPDVSGDVEQPFEPFGVAGDDES